LTRPSIGVASRLAALRLSLGEATLIQQLEDWIGSHVRAFEFFGGVTQLEIPDNL